MAVSYRINIVYDKHFVLELGNVNINVRVPATALCAALNTLRFTITYSIPLYQFLNAVALVPHAVILLQRFPGCSNTCRVLAWPLFLKNSVLTAISFSL